jgi:hypothetical protein
MEPGETILWEGAPKPGIINWTGFAVGTAFGAVSTFMGFLGVYQGLQEIFVRSAHGIVLRNTAVAFLFLVGGPAILVESWWVGFRKLRTARYAVSSRCAYIYDGRPTPTLKMYPIHKDLELKLDTRKGYSNVWFQFVDNGDGGIIRSGFEAIVDGATPYNLIKDIRATAQ